MIASDDDCRQNGEDADSAPADAPREHRGDGPRHRPPADPRQVRQLVEAGRALVDPAVLDGVEDREEPSD
ncbi:MAG: hypothetical protein ACKO22_04275 [Cyanobium sp.]